MLEVNKKKGGERRPFKVMDRFRLFRKGIMAATLEELIIKGIINLIPTSKFIKNCGEEETL